MLAWNMSSYGSAAATACRTFGLSNGAIAVFIVMWVNPLLCGIESTFAFADFASVEMSLAARSMHRSASPRSTRLARVAASGTVWMMIRLKNGNPSPPAAHFSFRRRIVASPGLWLSIV